MASVADSKLKGPGWLREMFGDMDRFWFAAGSPTSLGVFRILVGLANLGSLLLLLPFFDAWFTQRGFTPVEVNERYTGTIARDFYFFNWRFELPFTVPRVDVFASLTNSHIFFACFLILILAAVLTTLGLWTRVSSIVLAIGVVSLQHRNEIILHGGDTVVRLGALYMAIAPSGKACSLDRLIGLWKGRIKKGPVLVSLWPQRIIAYNLALIYFTTWWVKMDGDRWRNGTATWYPARLNEFHRFWVPPFMMSAWMAPVLTYATLATELALGTIVFWRPARKWVLLAGLLMHGWIEYSMNIPMFAFSICSYYIAFYEGEEVSAWALRMGSRLKRLHLRVPVSKDVESESGPALAVKAADAFGLVAYTRADDEVRPDVGQVARATYFRSPGAWVLGLVPGLWRRIVAGAIGSGA